MRKKQAVDIVMVQRMLIDRARGMKFTEIGKKYGIPPYRAHRLCLEVETEALNSSLKKKVTH
jgi:hypothetical protein